MYRFRFCIQVRKELLVTVLEVGLRLPVLAYHRWVPVETLGEEEEEEGVGWAHKNQTLKHRPISSSMAPT